MAREMIPPVGSKKSTIHELVRAYHADIRPAAASFAADTTTGESAAKVWLAQALQEAVRIEFATIPPYLCALWSIKDEKHPAAISIREIAQQEMLHVAFASNLLAALGGTPQLTGAANVPTYPGALPAGVHRGLVVSLSRLDEASLETFLAIERPEKPLPERIGELPAPPQGDVTIGEFYDAILHCLQNLPNLALRTERQITGLLSWSVITSLEDAGRAIATIKHQGEGSSSSPLGSSRKDLAHYYRFEEIQRRRQLVWNDATGKFEDGKPMPPLDVWPMRTIPAGGYDSSSVSPEVDRLLVGFDRAFTKLITLLESAWGTGGQASFLRAMECMFELQPLAKRLMQTPIPDSDETYGPCFRFREE